MRHLIRLIFTSAFLAVFTSQASAQLTWTKRTVNTTTPLYALVSGSSVFSAGAASQKTFRSVGGTTWAGTPQKIGILDKLVYGSGIFVGVSRYDSPGIAWSATGAAYTAATLPIAVNSMADVAFGNSKFGAVSPLFSGSTYLFSSTDGKAWTKTSFLLPAITGQTVAPARIALGAGVYVAYADQSTSGGTPSGLFSSANGTTWTLRLDLKGVKLNAITFDNNQFVGVGPGGVIYTSPNGTAWTARSSGTVATLEGIAFGKATWVAVGVCGTIRISTNNGVAWTASTSNTYDDLYNVAFGNNTFVAVGESGLILQSN